MRYLNWDVLIFSDIGDSKTPIQEFGTVCNVIQDPDTTGPSLTGHGQFSMVSHPLPIVTSYIPSLPSGTPFRISLHTWTAPVPNRATRALVKEDSMVYYEAKVLLDGICTAGITIAGGELCWPQIIDRCTTVKKGDEEQLKFPSFHTEMLKQVWNDASQNMGRVKIVISEGIFEGEPTSTYKRLRNIVAFSFFHAPLHILEDTGIAWPNPGMWWQAQPQFSNPSSRKGLPDPEDHTHSPRVGKHSVAYPSNHEPLWSQPVQVLGQNMNRACPDDPFVRVTSRGTARSGDVSMSDTSRYGSSNHDVPMPDYSRPLSPGNIARTCYSIPGPSDGFRKEQDNIHVNPSVLILEKDHSDSGLHVSENAHQNNENIVSRSPRIMSGISAPSNTRANSANNTPPDPQHDASAAVSRAVSRHSYSNHQRAVPVPVNDLPPAYECLSSNLDKQQNDVRISSFKIAQARSETPALRENAAIKKPIGRPKGKKEGRTSDVSLETPLARSAKRSSTDSTAAENTDRGKVATLKSSDIKRKRMVVVTSGSNELKGPDGHDGAKCDPDETGRRPEGDTPTRKASKHIMNEASSPSKHEYVNDLSLEGSITCSRKPLGELENLL